MGKKKTKTRQTNRPVYEAEIGGAAQAQQAAYNRQLPQINAYADRVSGVSDDLLSQYRQGDPTIQASQNYVQDILAQDPGSNPHLDSIIERTNNDLQRQIRTNLGTRGNLGGSTELDILSDALSGNALNLRYQDYNNTLDRQGRAAGLSTNLLAGSLLPLDAALKTGREGATLPLDAALRNSAGVGGLLGQFQDVEGETRQSGGLLGSIIGAGIGGLAGQPGLFG